jgi:hypothetical protein
MRARASIVVLVAVLAALAACGSDDPFDKLPDPGTVTTIPAITTSTEVDFSSVPLNGVPGTTSTTVALGPGPMTIVGIVQGPDGVVSDAVVQLERLVGDGVASTRVPTAPDGTWNLEKVLGGRYRIRAWRAPDLATAKPAIVFIESDGQQSVTLDLAEVGGTRVDAVIAPDPPVVDHEANLKVRVVARTVDSEGVVRDTPSAGESVTLSGTGQWELSGPSSSFTGTDGTITFRVICREAGQQQLFANLADGQGYALNLPACVEPASSTTTTTTTPDEGSTTTSASSTTTTTEA